MLESCAMAGATPFTRRTFPGRYALALGLVGAIAAMAPPPVAASGLDANGGGSTHSMTRFGLGIHDGTGQFEHLMPAIMTVEATVTSATATTTGADLRGTAAVTLAHGTPCGPPGRLVVGTPFTASVVAGGPGVGKLDLTILGMDFPGTVEQGQIRIGP